MFDTAVLDLGREALRVALYLAGPLLIGALVAGVGVSIFQAITQVNEATMTFIPKILMVVGILAVTGPWMLETITSFTRDLILSIPEMIR